MSDYGIEREVEKLRREVRGLRNDIARLEDRPMSWVEARAYSDPSFARARLVDQLEADVGKANRLPPVARSEVKFEMKKLAREPVIRLRRSAFDKADAVRIAAMEGVLLAVLLGPGGWSRKLTITARYDAASKQVQWFIGGEGPPLSLADVSRTILEPTLFS